MRSFSASVSQSWKRTLFVLFRQRQARPAATESTRLVSTSRRLVARAATALFLVTGCQLERARAARPSAPRPAARPAARAGRGALARNPASDEPPPDTTAETEWLQRVTAKIERHEGITAKWMGDDAVWSCGTVGHVFRSVLLKLDCGLKERTLFFSRIRPGLRVKS